MVAAQYAYSKGRTLARRVSGTFAILFGFFALLFTATPKLWGNGGSNGLSTIFSQNIAHADTPHTGGAYTGGGTCGDSCGCRDVADSGVADTGGNTADTGTASGDTGGCSF